jgi:hypothetical protein
VVGGAGRFRSGTNVYDLNPHLRVDLDGLYESMMDEYNLKYGTDSYRRLFMNQWVSSAGDDRSR